MITVVVDIDDTLIDTRRRMQGIWHHVLNCRIPLQAIEDLNLRQIFEKYASQDQKARTPELRRRFFELLLCEDEVGIDLAELDEPIPFAAEALQAWSNHCIIVYLTGRPETTRDITMAELEKFGFPTENIQMAMVDLEDWRTGAVTEARNRLLSSISQRHAIVRIVDDYPAYFTIYRQFDITDRIGLLRSKRFSPQDFINHGATRVVESWKPLIEDIPK